jgi:predicted ATPase/DNA-binding SARP family transcriptional activator
MDFRLLGPLEVRRHAAAAVAPLGKPGTLLAVLLLRANEPMPGQQLIEALWHASPPRTADNLVHGYISGLRKDVVGFDRIETVGGSYRLLAEDGEIDARRFERLLDEGTQALAEGEAAEAAAVLRQALALWRGDAVSGIDVGDSFAPEVRRLEELRLRALESRIDADLACGRHAEVVAELESLTSRHPLREGLWSRLMVALYRSGRQGDALEQYRRARAVLVGELGIEPGDALREVERAILRQDAWLAAAPRTGGDPRPKPSLPAPVTPLVGRERDVTRVCDLLRRSDVHLVTISGVGGIGKTRLAIEAARRLTGEFAHGVVFVELSSLLEPELVVPAIARAFGVAAQDAELVDAIGWRVARRSLLVVLDNLEHLLSAAPTVASLFSAAPRVKVLVTSRAVLHVSGEHEVPLAPLEVPVARAELDAVRAVSSVTLFVQRSRAAGVPDFELTPQNVEAVAEICRRLDGLPLAIELAAARAKLLSPEAMLARPGRRLELLAVGARDAPARQQTLRATIDWSFELLDDHERRLFSRLAVFAGGWTLEAAEAVCGAPVIETLSSLVDKSLVFRTGVADDRFTMLDVIYEYALEQLDARGETDELRRRHSAFFGDLALAAEPELEGEHAAAWLERLERDHENLRAALDWSVEREDAEWHLRVAVALCRYWYVRGRVAEGARRLAAALARIPVDSSPLRANALRRRAVLELRAGASDEAVRCLEESLEIAHALGDRRATATALLSLAGALANAGELERASDAADEAGRVFEELGETRGIAAARNNAGVVALVAGDYERARDLFTQSLALGRDLHDRENAAVGLCNLGFALLELGENSRAVEALTESLVNAEAVGFKEQIVCALEGVAAAALSFGDAPGAALLVGAAGALGDEVGFCLDLYERTRRGRTLAALEVELGADAIESALAAGRRSADGDILTFALERAAQLPVAAGRLPG